MMEPQEHLEHLAAIGASGVDQPNYRLQSVFPGGVAGDVEVEEVKDVDVELFIPQNLLGIRKLRVAEAFSKLELARI